MIASSHVSRHGSAPGALLVTALIATSLAPTGLLGASFELRLRQADGSALEGAVFSAVLKDDQRLPPPRRKIMDQLDLTFEPHILPVQVGAVVEFPNSDTVGHHVYSFSPAKRFQLFLATGDAPKTVTFDRPGEVALGCNVHDWMLAYILVLETAYFGQTDAEGRAVLASLPAGRYRLAIWHPRIGEESGLLTREAAVDRDGKERWDLLLTKRLLPSRSQRPGFSPY